MNRTTTDALPVAHVAPDVAAWLDSDGTLRAAGLMVVTETADGQPAMPCPACRDSLGGVMVDNGDGSGAECGACGYRIDC